MVKEHGPPPPSKKKTGWKQRAAKRTLRNCCVHFAVLAWRRWLLLRLRRLVGGDEGHNVRASDGLLAKAVSVKVMKGGKAGKRGLCAGNQPTYLLFHPI